MLVKMTAKQIREIKTRRYIVQCSEWIDIGDCDFIFTDSTAYKINRITGIEETLCYENAFIDHSKSVEGFEDDAEVLVEASVYRSWLDTKELNNE